MQRNATSFPSFCSPIGPSTTNLLRVQQQHHVFQCLSQQQKIRAATEPHSRGIITFALATQPAGHLLNPASHTGSISCVSPPCRRTSGEGSIRYTLVWYSSACPSFTCTLISAGIHPQLLAVCLYYLAKKKMTLKTDRPTAAVAPNSITERATATSGLRAIRRSHPGPIVLRAAS